MSELEPAIREELQQTLITRLRDDPALALKMGRHAGRSNFFAALDRGEAFDEALDLGMSVTHTWTEYFETIALSGVIPVESTAIDGCPEMLAAIDVGEQDKRDPSDTRKKLASLVLRQEAQTRTKRIPTSMARLREFASGSEV